MTAEHSHFWQRQWQWWHTIGPPLRPSETDVALMEEAVNAYAGAQMTNGQIGLQAPVALLLGVTPELAAMRWPQGTSLRAVDKSQEMIDRVWPGTAPTGAQPMCGHWLKLPLPTASVDIVVGDGVFSQVSYPEEAAGLVEEIRRVLRPGGLFALRTFVRPQSQPSVEQVFRHLEAGEYGSFHVFKWCLNMALQPSLQEGVRLDNVWKIFIDRYPEPARLALARGWPRQDVETIHAYEGSPARFFYPTLTELRHYLETAFDETACREPAYELGERCPHLQLWRH